MNYSRLCVPILTLIISQSFLWDLALFRFPRKKIIQIFVIEVVVVLAISGSVLLLLGLEVYASWYVLIIVIPMMGPFVYTSKRRDARDVFTILTIIIINFAISIPAMWLSQYHENQYFYYNLVRIILFVIFFLVVHIFFVILTDSFKTK